MDSIADQPIAQAQAFVYPVAIACTALSLFLCQKRLKGADKPFLDKERHTVKVLDVKELSHDTKRIRLGLGSDSKLLGLPVGKHVQVFSPNPESCLTSGKWNGKPDPDKGAKEIVRAYTPVTGNETRGYFDLVFKVYRPGDVTMPDGSKVTWEDGGKSSCYLDGKKVGDTVDIKGPVGVKEYLGRGEFKVPGRTAKVTQVGMMAGGTGITPMLQIVSAALRDENDTCKFTLLYANKTEGDILCRDLLSEAEERSNGRFKVHYTLDFAPEGWKHEKGFITADMIKKIMPPPSEDTLMLMCGPPPMVEFACKKNLLELGYDKTSMVAC